MLLNNNETEGLKAVVELGKDIASDLVRPTSKSVGENLGLFVDGVMGWLGYWGEKQRVIREYKLAEYKKKITRKVEAIAEENLVEPPVRIVGPAIEASKFAIDEEICQEMFSKLIASACDASTIDMLHPSFPNIVSQLSPLDAKLLQTFMYHSTYPAARIKVRHKDGIVTPYNHLLFDFSSKKLPIIFNEKEQLRLTDTVDCLVRFGLIRLNSEIIELAYDYEKFKSHWYYVSAVASGITETDTMQMVKYRIELTELGKNFVRCCVPDSGT